MAIEVRWLLPGRIVFHRFSGAVTLEDTTQSSLEGPILAASGMPPVHMLIDLLGVSHYPRNIRQLEVAIRHNPRLDQLGWVVIVIRHNPVLRFIATILTQVSYSRLRVALFEDQAAALRFLREHDPGLAADISPAGDLITPPLAD